MTTSTTGGHFRPFEAEKSDTVLKPGAERHFLRRSGAPDRNKISEAGVEQEKICIASNP